MFIKIISSVLTLGCSVSFISAGSLQKRCNRGDRGACETLGVMYITGDGVRVNGHAAIKYLEKACSMGSASACNSSAFIYADAEGGVRQDYTKAMRYWNRACRLGDESGCSNYRLAEDKLEALREGRQY